MHPLTEAQFRTYNDVLSAITELCSDVARYRFMGSDPRTPVEADFRDFEIDGDTITGYYGHTYRGSDDDWSICFPVGYLFDGNWQAAEDRRKAEELERVRQQQEAQKAEKAAQRERKKLSERAEYERLKKIYEPDAK